VVFLVYCIWRALRMIGSIASYLKLDGKTRFRLVPIQYTYSSIRITTSPLLRTALSIKTFAITYPHTPPNPITVFYIPLLPPLPITKSLNSDPYIYCYTVNVPLRPLANTLPLPSSETNDHIRKLPKLLTPSSTTPRCIP